MNNLLASQNNALRISFAALLVFLGRAFIDYYYVYEEFGLSMALVALSIAVNLALFGGWIWGLVTMAQNSRRGAVAVFGFNLFFWLFIGVGTLVAWCPSPCTTAWPLAEMMNWLSLVFGLLATASVVFYLKTRSK